MPGILLSQFIENPGFWIGNFNQKIYIDWKKRISSIDYVFRQDISTIFKNTNTKEEFKALFNHPNKQHPQILQLLLNNDISLETFTILESIFPFYHLLDKNISTPIVWNKKKAICKKYLTFLTFDAIAYKQILTDKLKDLL